MKFEARKSTLQEALGIANMAVPSKSTLQILNNFLLRLEGNFLEITATDLDLGLRIRCEVQGHRDGSIVVNARKLLDLVKVLPDEPITIAVDNYMVTVRWRDKGKASMTGFDAADFPGLPTLEDAVSFQISLAELGFLHEKTAFAASTDSTRPALNGVFMEQRESHLIWVATDGHRLGRAQVDLPALGLSRGVILPSKAVQYALRAIPDDATLDVQVGPAHVLFAAENVQVVSKLVDGTYPKYENVIPQQFDRIVRASREEFIDVVRHVSAIASSRTRQVRMHLDGNTAEVSSTDQNAGGDCRETFQVQHMGDGPFTVGFNGAYLLEILEKCPSEEVALKLNSPVGACIIEPQGEGFDFFFLIMPLRLVEDV